MNLELNTIKSQRRWTKQRKSRYELLFVFCVVSLIKLPGFWKLQLPARAPEFDQSTHTSVTVVSHVLWKYLLWSELQSSSKCSSTNYNSLCILLWGCNKQIKWFLRSENACCLKARTFNTKTTKKNLLAETKLSLFFKRQYFTPCFS